MNQCIKKAPSVGAIILISAATATLISIVSAIITFALGDSMKLSLVISLIVFPAILSTWFLASMVTYTVSKYKGNISGWTDLNLRASSLTIGVVLFAVAIALTVLTVFWRVDPISVISAVLNG